MKNYDIQEDILGCSCDEVGSSVELYLSKNEVSQLVHIYSGSNLFMETAFLELARVYELVRQGKV